MFGLGVDCLDISHRFDRSRGVLADIGKEFVDLLVLLGRREFFLNVVWGVARSPENWRSRAGLVWAFAERIDELPNNLSGLGHFENSAVHSFSN